VDQSNELEDWADLPGKSIAQSIMLSKRKEDASYTKSEGGGGTTGYVSAGEKRSRGRRGTVAKQQHAAAAILQHSINALPKRPPDAPGERQWAKKSPLWQRAESILGGE
jgi:hypothetical protein